jgi:hypothetical protein
MAMKNPKIVSAKTKITIRGTPPTMEEVIGIGKMVQEEVALHNKSIVEKAAQMLAALGVKRVTLPSESERNIFSEAVLVRHDLQDHFHDVVKTLRRIHGTHIIWNVNGPLPPYNFSDGKFALITQKTLGDARSDLGLEEDFTMEQLKEAYRQKARETHPDQNGPAPEAKERFEKIETAYRLLRKVCHADSAKRTNGAGENGADFLLLMDPVEGERRVEA